MTRVEEGRVLTETFGRKAEARTLRKPLVERKPLILITLFPATIRLPEVDQHLTSSLAEDIIEFAHCQSGTAGVNCERIQTRILTKTTQLKSYGNQTISKALDNLEALGMAYFPELTIKQTPPTS